MKRTAVLNVVGLTTGLIGSHTPRIAAHTREFGCRPVQPALPAVTCTAQSDYLTGRLPSHHGIVANGWYDRQLAEVQFWKQSNHLVAGPKLWEVLKQRIPGFTCAKLFWWYNMYSSADYSITPRPMYPADGRKFFDVYSWPYEMRPAVKSELGEFPFATFWGPAAGRQSPQGSPDAASRWIAGSARWTESTHSPSLSLVYLPHLDYNLQRFGPCRPGTREPNPDIIRDLQEIDSIVGGLIDFFRTRGVQVILLSEYGITNVHRPIHINRHLRAAGLLTLKEELGLELLDAGNSPAFAVADHQVAHVYLKDPRQRDEVRRLLASIPGVATVLDTPELREVGLAHSRCGDLVALASEDSWFTYYYWDDDRRAPDFARCVDIHRKPGYDPVELFLDPALSFPKFRIARRLLQKKLGFRMLMDVIPLDASLVKGSHGIRPAKQSDWPVYIGPGAEDRESLQSTDIFGLLAAAVEN